MKLFSKTIFLVSIFLSIWTCGSSTSSSPLPEVSINTPKPAWLLEYPVNPNYYIGIGSASKNQYGSEAYKSAQDLALADMASQITVTITSDIVTTLIEKGALSEEEYLATARSQAVADLEGHELVDSWQDGDYHYVYYRLSKAKYAAIQARKRQAALALAKDFYQQALSAAGINNFSDAFGSALQAFRPLLPYLNEALILKIDGQSIILSNRINQLIQSLITDISLVPNQTNIQGELGKPLAEPLRIFAKTSEGKAIRNLPLSAHFKKGSGVFNESLHTGGKGYADLQVSAITSGEKLQVLEITLDLTQLTSGLRSPILSGIVSSIPKASTHILIDVSNPTIYLESTEIFNGKVLTQLQIEPKLKNHFIQQGFHFVDTPAQADWQMTLKATATKGTEFSGMYTVFTDVSLNVIDRSTGDEIYKNSLSRVKGIDLSYRNAANKALSTAADKLNATVLPQILDTLK